MVPGPIPSYAMAANDFTNVDATNASDLADAYVNLGGKSSPPNYEWYFGYYANQKVVFLLELINRKKEMTLELMERIDRDLNITMDTNPEVKQRWYPLSIGLGYFVAFEPAHTFVSVQGRMKYLNPIY